MPRRAHGRPLLAIGPSKPAKHRPKRSAALNALETAERQNPNVIKIRQHRLGEVEGDSDGPESRADVDERSSKRRKVENSRQVDGEDEDMEEGSDLEGGTWHTGVNDDDEDSDLDSDEAFGESDEEKFADFTFRGSSTNTTTKRATKKQTKVKKITLDEDIESGTDEDSASADESDTFADEAVDLATAWDMDEAEQTQKKTKSSKDQHDTRSKPPDSDDSSPEVSDDGQATEEEDMSQFSVSEDELGGDTAALRTFVESLSNSTSDKPARQSQSASGATNRASSGSRPSNKLSAADLLQYVKDPAQRQSLKILQSAERSGPEDHKGGIPGKLSAPLAKRQQDRLDRAAAYDRAKETLNRWTDTVKQNRRAEHLSFPLIDHAKESVTGQKQLAPTSQSAPITTLEATINEIMQESGLGSGKGQSVEEQEQEYENLAERKMDIDDVRARRAELRMARELMFREEIRAKRIKKIKSRAYRRVHRKERDKIETQQREAMAAAGLLDSDEEREKNDRRRAEERMGARHRESKWAKGAKQVNRTAWDEDARLGVSDLARRDEELRRRVAGKDVRNSEGSDAETESDLGSDEEADTDTEGRSIANKLNALEQAGGIASKSKLGQLAFMQRAEAAQKAENDRAIQQLRLALDDTTQDFVASDDDDDDDDHHHHHPEPTGRQKFGSAATQQKTAKQSPIQRNELEARLSDDEDADASPSVSTEAVRAIAAPASQPAQEVVTQGKVGVKSRPIADKSSRVTKQSAKSKAPLSENSQRRKAVRDDYPSLQESENEWAHDVNADEAKAALAASIFAGPDDAAQDFAREKAEVVEEEGDQVVDNTLPGWGSWTGSGISKREQKKAKGRFLSTVKGVAPEKRQDARLDRVIVNEKRVKKNGKYLATELPHPFETRQQYERSLRLPIGPEWSTTTHYQDSIKPRVLLKQGTVIRPIAKPIA